MRELGLERVEVEALVVHRERHDLGSVAREDLQRPVVGRPLDEHAPRPHGELHGGVEHEALQAARRQEDAAGLDAVALREHLAQRAVATARAVGEDRDPVALERRAGAVGDQGRVEAFRAPARRAQTRSVPCQEPTRTAPPQLDENRSRRRIRSYCYGYPQGVALCRPREISFFRL